jgi:TPR repeat protein
VTSAVSNIQLLLLLSLLGMASASFAENDDKAPVKLSADLDLNSSQQSSLATEAIKGSPEAARKLATYHFIVRGDRTLALKWYTVGAENGDPACAFGLYNLLNGSNDRDEQLRAMFWLHKSADGGLNYARDELKALEKSPRH